MDISIYAASAEDIDPLSAHQIASFFNRHVSVTKDLCNRTATEITGSQVSPTLVQGQTSYTVAADASALPTPGRLTNAHVILLARQVHPTEYVHDPTVSP